MKVTPHAVRRQLEQLGYSNVPDEVVMEFLAELQAEADSKAAAETEPVLAPQYPTSRMLVSTAWVCDTVFRFSEPSRNARV